MNDLTFEEWKAKWQTLSDELEEPARSELSTWLGWIQTAYDSVEKRRVSELKGNRSSHWRGDGLHDYSYAWGHADAICPEWVQTAMANDDDLGVTPMGLRRAAEQDALARFVDGLRVT